MALSDLDLTKPSDKELAGRLRDLQEQIREVALQLDARGYNIFGRIDSYNSYDRDERYDPTSNYKIIINKTITVTESL